MGLKIFRIYFDKLNAIYYGGEQLTGKIVVNLDSPKKIRCISVTYKGEANVRWTERRTRRTKGRSHSRSVHFTAEENYFESTHYLAGSSDGDLTLQPGEQTFNFCVILPNDLPSSFEGSYGYVRYTVRAKIERPWKFNHEAKAAFSVLSNLDLNLDATLKEPVSRTDDKTLWCCCCKSGPLTLVMNVSATGFVPGQEIPVTIEVDNASNTNIRNVVCTLVKKVHFHAKFPHNKTKTETVKETKISFESVSANGSKTWLKNLKVPALPPSQLINCSIIDIEYLLKAEAITGSLHKNLQLEIPIIVGTIPLLTYIPTGMPAQGVVPNIHTAASPSLINVPPQPTTSGASWAPGISQDHNKQMNVAPSAPPAPYPDLPPPSYEECIYGTKNICDDEDSKHTHGEKEFAPKYPVYNWKT